MPIAYKKKSSTIILIGDNGSNKKHILQLLRAACLGTTADEFFSMKDELPSPDDTAKDSSFYTIRCADGSELNVLDTPELGDAHDEDQVNAIEHAIKSLVTTIDAIVVLVDHAKTALGAAVEPTLGAIFSLFPRPIVKNTYFLFTYPAKEEPNVLLLRENWPSWLLDDQISGSIGDIVDLRTDLQARFAKPSPPIVKAFSKNFGRALEVLQGVLQQVDSSSIEAWDMNYLYRRAIKIESSIHHALSLGDGTSADSDDSTIAAAEKDIQKVIELVEEYLLLSTSPDFVTHLGLVTALLSTDRGTEKLEPYIGKLEDANKSLQALEKGGGNFPKGFIVC